MTETTKTPQWHRDEADRLEREAYESFARCDTDGFLSQHVQGLSARKHRLQAEVIEKGGRWEFDALFDLDGNLVAAKVVEGRYGPSWGILASDDPRSKIVAWVNAFPKRTSTI